MPDTWQFLSATRLLLNDVPPDPGPRLCPPGAWTCLAWSILLRVSWAGCLAASQRDRGTTPGGTSRPTS